jgi:hypothetical protein
VHGKRVKAASAGPGHLSDLIDGLAVLSISLEVRMLETDERWELHAMACAQVIQFPHGIGQVALLEHGISVPE